MKLELVVQKLYQAANKEKKNKKVKNTVISSSEEGTHNKIDQYNDVNKHQAGYRL